MVYDYPDTKIAITLRTLIVTRGVEWIIETAYRGINHAMEGENILIHIHIQIHIRFKHVPIADVSLTCSHLLSRV
jgi:hypothetical protein